MEHMNGDQEETTQQHPEHAEGCHWCGRAGGEPVAATPPTAQVRRLEGHLACIRRRIRRPGPDPYQLSPCHEEPANRGILEFLKGDSNKQSMNRSISDHQAEGNQIDVFGRALAASHLGRAVLVLGHGRQAGRRAQLRPCLRARRESSCGMQMVFAPAGVWVVNCGFWE